MNYIRISWAALKKIRDADLLGTELYYQESSKWYEIILARKGIQFRATIIKATPKPPPQVGFETNYKSGAVDITSK